MIQRGSRLILVRHGETEGESSIRYHGRTDVALSELGTRADAPRGPRDRDASRRRKLSRAFFRVRWFAHPKARESSRATRRRSSRSMNSPKFTSDCSKDSPRTRFASAIPTSSRDGTPIDSRRATPIPTARAAPTLPIASSAAWNACWLSGRSRDRRRAAGGASRSDSRDRAKAHASRAHRRAGLDSYSSLRRRLACRGARLDRSPRRRLNSHAAQHSRPSVAAFVERLGE